MENCLLGLEPSVLWRHFYDLTQIPHGSRNELELANHIWAMANDKKLDPYMDLKNNVFVRLPASAGCEDLPSVCLQSHLDMVVAKHEDVNFVFPIRCYIEDNCLFAKETTLGADNGIGVAAMMSLIETEIPHGPLELLFTTEEEVGMVGITGFDFTLIKSKFIVNLDSEVENHLFVGSAGYIYSSIKFPKKQTVVIAKEGDVIMDILLCGMMGGHSGLDIHKGCTNAIIAMAAIMQALNNLPINLVNLKGGDKVNQIPNEAKVSILLPGILVDEVTALLKNNTAKIAEMYFDDIVLHQDIFSVDMGASVSIIENAQELFLLLLSLPNGVLGMEPLRADLVRTSCNLGVIKADYEAFCVEALLRSSSMGDMEVYQSRINALAGHFGASVKVVNQSISWQPKFDTQLLKTCRAVALNVFGVEPEIVSIHAGLECAAFDVALPSAQKISFGPLIKGAHTIRECVDLQSVERFWQFLTKLLLAVKY